MPKRKSTEELRRYKKKPRRRLNYLTIKQTKINRKRKNNTIKNQEKRKRSK